MNEPEVSGAIPTCNRKVLLRETLTSILTVRHPISWLDSFINHQLGRDNHPLWDTLRDLRFRPGVYQHPTEEQILKKHGLYTLDGYFSYWARHNGQVLEKVPEDQLFIVRTDEITSRASEIAAFWSLEYVPAEGNQASHTFRAKKKFDILSQIDQDYLLLKMKTHCEYLLYRLFES